MATDIEQVPSKIDIDRWPLGDGDLPSQKARENEPRLRGLENNPVFRLSVFQSRAPGARWAFLGRLAPGIWEGAVLFYFAITFDWDMHPLLTPLWRSTVGTQNIPTFFPPLMIFYLLPPILFFGPYIASRGDPGRRAGFLFPVPKWGLREMRSAHDLPAGEFVNALWGTRATEKILRRKKTLLRFTFLCCAITLLLFPPLSRQIFFFGYDYFKIYLLAWLGVLYVSTRIGVLTDAAYVTLPGALARIRRIRTELDFFNYDAKKILSIQLGRLFLSFILGYFLIMVGFILYLTPDSYFEFLIIDGKPFEPIEYLLLVGAIGGISLLGFTIGVLMRNSVHRKSKELVSKMEEEMGLILKALDKLDRPTG